MQTYAGAAGEKETDACADVQRFKALVLGTHFTCFPGKKVQILTQNLLLGLSRQYAAWLEERMHGYCSDRCAYAHVCSRMLASADVR